MIKNKMKTKTKRVENRSRQANWQRRQRQSGRCANCGNPCRGYRCPRCNENRREKHRLYMAQQRAVGKYQ